MELTLTADMFLPRQEQPYCSLPTASCSIVNAHEETPPAATRPALPPTQTSLPPPQSSLPIPGEPNSGLGGFAASINTIPPTPSLLKPGQGSFRKVCRTEEVGPSPFPGLGVEVLEMRVKEGSKIRNLMGFAMRRMQGKSVGGASTGGEVRQVVFAGSGRAVTKTITCAEIMKRKVGGLHQLTKLSYRSVREVWESSEGGASEMTVHRTVPSISILLSMDPLDPAEPGYQPPEALGCLWAPLMQEDREGGRASKRHHSPETQSSQPGAKRPCSVTDGGPSGPTMTE